MKTVLFIYIFIRVELIYNVVVVSGVQQFFLSGVGKLLSNTDEIGEPCHTAEVLENKHLLESWRKSSQAYIFGKHADKMCQNP